MHPASGEPASAPSLRATSEAAAKPRNALSAATPLPPARARSISSAPMPENTTQRFFARVMSTLSRRSPPSEDRGPKRIATLPSDPRP